MGGAQPLAATMAGASMLAVECRQSRIDKRLETGYLDVAGAFAGRGARHARRSEASRQSPFRWRLLGNIVDVLHELLERGIKPDALTDQTSAHDPVNGYLPQGWSVEQWDERRVSDPAGTAAAAIRLDGQARRIPAALQAHGTAGVRLRQQYPPGRAATPACKQAFDFPGFVPEYIRPLFCRGIGPFRWAALSGDPEDIYKTDAKVKELIPDDRAPASLARHGARAHRIPGSAGAHLLGRPGPAPSPRARLQRHGRRAASCRRPSSSAATTWTQGRWPARTARPKPCRTDRTRSPTGRCSTRC